MIASSKVKGDEMPCDRPHGLYKSPSSYDIRPGKQGRVGCSTTVESRRRYNSAQMEMFNNAKSLQGKEKIRRI